MQQSQFIESIKNPTMLSQNTNELKFVVDEFPYCQTAHLMYAGLLKKNDDILFEEYLKKAAVYCTDRQHLFYQLHAVVEKKVEDKVVEKSTIKEEKIEEKVELIDEVVEEKATTKQVEEEKPKEPTKIDALEQQLRAAAINSYILLETEEDKQKSSTQEQPLTEKEEAKSNQPTFDVDSPHSFAEWLSHFKGDAPIANDAKTTTSNIDKFDLINKFIQEDPKIQPKKTEFYSPITMARLSVVDNSDMVSETLALIHVDQGHYQKAIEMYEKLSLKYPKKSSYFATQIKNLKQKQK